MDGFSGLVSGGVLLRWHAKHLDLLARHFDQHGGANIYEEWDMNRERVQMLRDMIAGLPPRNVNLVNEYSSKTWDGSWRNPPEPCGAIACIAGWAWIYPPFIAQGIRADQPAPCPASVRFFDVPGETFAQRYSTERGTNKEIALRRLDALLK